MLSGKSSKNNSKFRNMFYSKVDIQLFEKQKKEKNKDGVIKLIEQFENVIDCNLGIDFPNEKRKKLRSFQKIMLKKKKVLDDAGDYDFNTSSYLEEVSEYHKEYLYNSSLSFC